MSRWSAPEMSPPASLAHRFSASPRKKAPPIIPAEEAAKITLEGVANKQGIIALPEKYRQMWRQYWSDPEAAESILSGYGPAAP